MSARPEPPRFSMERAAAPPVYASPARADAPQREQAAESRQQVAESRQQAAESRQQVVRKEPSLVLPAARCPLPALNTIPAPPDTRGATLIMGAIIYWTVLVGLVVLLICTWRLTTYEPPAKPLPCVVTATRTCEAETSLGKVTISLGTYGGVYASTEEPKSKGRRP